MELIRVVLLSAMLLASPLFAQSALDSADEAYGQRKNDRAKIQSALKFYNQAITEADNNDYKVYAVEQIGRLSNYEGTLLEKTSKTKSYREQLFDSCLKATDKISPAALGEKLPAFFYVRGLCLAQWAKARGITTSLSRTKELLGYLNDGRSLDPSYEGGGFDRILAAVYLNLPPINVFGPTRDYKTALKHATSALNSPAYEGAFNPAFETGMYYFNAYEYQATALSKLGKKADAIKTLEAALARIKRNDINSERDPETSVDYKNLTELLNDIK